MPVLNPRFAGLTLASAVLFVGCGAPPNEYVAPPPPDVTVMRPVVQSIVEYIEENGETEAVERVEVRARVRGFVQAIEFAPGQTVDRETLLYQIEDDEYVARVKLSVAEVAAAEAAISVAKAQILTSQAEVDRAARELERQRSLLSQQATSQSEFDAAIAADEAAKANLAAAESAVEAARATRQQSQARLDQSQLDLGYTQVTAPIAGRVTKTDIRLGNLVESGTELTVVVDDSRIFANFNISDRQLLQFREARDQSASGRMSRQTWSQVRVLLRRESDTGFPFEGRLDYVDQEGVDTTTGTLRLRAVFENEDGGLFPGLFVTVRVAVATRDDALLVPARAVLRDRVGPFLLIVGEDNRVERRDIQTGQQSEGWVVIDQGLAENERIIVEGLQRARPGIPVNPLEKTATPADLPPGFL